MLGVKVLQLRLERLPLSSQLRQEKMATRDLVLSILAEFPYLKCSQITGFARKLKGTPLSNQAVHKTLRQLLDETILSKQENKYCLNKDWLERAEKFFEKTRQKISFEKTLLV